MNYLKSKTVWSGAAAIVAAGVAYSAGEASSMEAIQLAVTGLIGIFLRGGLFAAVSAKF